MENIAEFERRCLITRLYTLGFNHLISGCTNGLRRSRLRASTFRFLLTGFKREDADKDQGKAGEVSKREFGHCLIPHKGSSYTNFLMLRYRKNRKFLKP